jgi:hypothetical protein
MDSIVLRLRAEFADSFGVVEVFGTEPYPDQVLLTSSPKGKPFRRESLSEGKGDLLLQAEGHGRA